MKDIIKPIGYGLIGGLLPLSIFLALNSSQLDEKQEVSAVFSNHNPPIHSVNFSNAPAGTPTDFVDASSKTLHSVVHVTTKVVRTTVQRDPFFEFFYGPGAGGRERQQFGEGSGSGVIISDDGYIVTNNHVIDDAKEIEITLNDNSTYTAKIVGTDPSTDLAVLKIEAKGLNAISFGNSDAINVGEWVLAVGNPFNLTSTVTAGIVSAKARNINIIGSKNRNIIPIESFIQTDAAVNPGNSGGALVNTRGELIGINTAIASQTGSYAGYSFAIPSILVKKVAYDIMDFGMVQRAFLGVQIAQVNQQLMDEKGFPDTRGVYVSGITEGSGAAVAKVKEGDVILKIGNRDVNTPAELQEEIGKRRPGDKISVTIRREKELLNKEILLKNQEGNTELKTKEEVERFTALGAKFRELTKEELKELNIDHGVKIADINTGKLKSLGLETGMIVTKVNNEKVKNVEQLTSILNSNQNRGILLEILTESGRKDYVGFGL
jgi:Do/DeqQ family serine protease